MATPKTQAGMLKDITSSPTVATAKKDAKPLMQFYTKFNNDWVMNFAAMLAYNLLMSVFPIALAVLSITGLILGNHLNSSIIASIRHILPGSVSSDVIASIISRLNHISGILGIIAVVLAIFFGSRLFVTIENCFDIIYHVRPRPVIRQNIVAILMLLLFVVLIPIMVVTSSGPTLILSILRKTALQSITNIGVILYTAGIIGGLLAAFILFEAIYVVMPNQRISFKHSWLGALVAAIALELYLLFFPLYTSHFLTGYAGQVGFAVILLVFFYYFAVILLVGAEVNAFFSEHVQPLPNDLATFATTMAGKLNKDRPAQESPSHQNPKPTNEKDAAHIAEAEKKTQPDEQQAKNSFFQRSSRNKTQRIQTPPNQPTKKVGKLPTVFEVAIGSTLALIIELLRQRHHSY